MITEEISETKMEEYKLIWLQHKDKLQPNRKSGAKLLNYLESNYILSKIEDNNILDCIIDNILMNSFNKDKIPRGATLKPVAFYLENKGLGTKFYKPENRDSIDLECEYDERIIIGLEIESGYYFVEGSTMLWDELYYVRGLDRTDLDNYVCVAEYINSLKRFGLY